MQCKPGHRPSVTVTIPSFIPPVTPRAESLVKASSSKHSHTRVQSLGGRPHTLHPLFPWQPPQRRCEASADLAPARTSWSTHCQATLRAIPITRVKPFHRNGLPEECTSFVLNYLSQKLMYLATSNLKRRE